MRRRDRVLLFDVEGDYFCPECFHARAPQRRDETVFEITLTTVISLCASLDRPQFVCSVCGRVAAEAPVLQVDNKNTAYRGILKNVPDRCPRCGDDGIIAEFEELPPLSRDAVTLVLRKWFCPKCNAEDETTENPSISCHIC